MNKSNIAKWEYKQLLLDTDYKWHYPGGFNRWYKEVFLKDEAWKEIREEENESNI